MLKMDTPWGWTQKAALNSQSHKSPWAISGAFLLLPSNVYEVLEHLKFVSFNVQLGWGD
jgi:hypothetical protein